MFNSNQNFLTIKTVYDNACNGFYVIDTDYQRRSVWVERDNARLIETILLNYIMPELFFWDMETDPDTGKPTTHIVDGQQRYTAIIAFINNEFSLKKAHLSEKESERFAGKFFKDLDSADKTNFWNYRLSIIHIDRSETKEKIKTMFKRLNMTNYSLTGSELRNSLSGTFAALARELSEHSAWEKHTLFNTGDVRRMRDVEFCGTLILLCRDGIIDQTTQKALNYAYEYLGTRYEDAADDKKSILNAISYLEKFIEASELVPVFLRRKTQLYTLFSFIFDCLEERRRIDKNKVQRFADFVDLYSVFQNDMELEATIKGLEKDVYDELKKYKLASSEGLNKVGNRTIRFNVLKNFIESKNGARIKAEKSLLKKMRKESSGIQPELDGFDDLDEAD
jgi:hypothetical protein